MAMNGRPLLIGQRERPRQPRAAPQVGPEEGTFSRRNPKSMLDGLRQTKRIRSVPPIQKGDITTRKGFVCHPTF
jgi:hypothetical protein